MPSHSTNLKLMQGKALSQLADRTVLLACLDPTAPSKIRRVLEHRGCKVFAVRDAADAAREIQGRVPAVIILDLENRVENMTEFLNGINSSAELGRLPIVMAGSPRNRQAPKTG